MSVNILEKLEDLFEDISNDMMPPYVGITCDTVIDVKWVIQYAKEQYERVKYLEEREKEIIEINQHEMQYRGELTFKNAELEERNKRYQEALEFYANKKTYRYYKESYIDLLKDGGYIARKALEDE